MRPMFVDDIKQEIKQSLQNDIRREVREIEDQKIRSMNLIIFNLEESQSSISSVRQQEDISAVKTLFDNIGVSNVDVNVGFRLGNKDPKKTRPLKLILNNKRQRKEIMDNVSKIKNLHDQNLKKCIVVKDLTPSQREINKQRRLEKIKSKPKKVNSTPNSEEVALDEDTIIDDRPERQHISSQSPMELSIIGNPSDEMYDSTIDPETTIIGGRVQTPSGILSSLYWEPCFNFKSVNRVEKCTFNFISLKKY